MTNITISQERFDRVLHSVETLIRDVSDLIDQDNIAKQRMADIKEDPSIGKGEKELNAYLKKRGVKVD